jgi:anti-sigma-K factor RskA
MATERIPTLTEHVSGLLAAGRQSQAIHAVAQAVEALQHVVARWGADLSELEDDVNTQDQRGEVEQLRTDLGHLEERVDALEDA